MSNSNPTTEVSAMGASGVQDKSHTSESIGHLVASHYNNLDEKGKEHRKESRIFHMRNLNNWIKSQLLGEYVTKVRSSWAGRYDSPQLRVLDMGCGKGGDLLKWLKADVDHVVCADIAATSVDQCRQRYRDMRNRNRQQRIFTAEFIAADCTKQRLKDLYEKDPDIKFDIVSCQFAFHYCFESLQQAECMLRNASECLKKGGYFIGTTPDANDIVSRLRKSKAANSVYSIEADNFNPAEDSDSRIPLFGARYKFHLEGVVDCPEFLVHFPTLSKLAEKHGLMLVAKRRFANYYDQFEQSGRQLLGRMNALETYPPTSGRSAAEEDDSYATARKFLATLGDHETKRVGTLSKEEWEAATLYVIFAFKKL